MPDAPTIQVVLDDSGASQGQVANSGQTDDTSPTLKILLPAGAQAGDTLVLNDVNDGESGPPGLPGHTITADEIAQGYVVLTVSASFGENDFSAHVFDSASGAGPTSATYSFVDVPDGAMTTTALTDGNHLQTYIDPDGVLQAQAWDGSADKVGAMLHFGGGGGDETSTYGALPLAGGAYLLFWHAHSSGGGWEEMRIVDSAGALATSESSGGGRNFSFTAGPDGGFVVTANPMPTDLPIQSYEPNEPIFRIFDNAGNPTANGGASGFLMLAGKLESVTTDDQGHVLLNWDDGPTLKTLTIDPLHPNLFTPPTPNATVIDDAGPQTGTVADSGTTDDTTPTFHVPVTQTGEVFVQFGQDTSYEFNTQGIAITADDVARGYIDVQANASAGDGGYVGFVRVTDDTGSSSEMQRIAFTLDTASPPPPSGGQTLQAQDGGSTLVGGSGDDTLIGAHGPDQMTGAGGADHFQFNEVPWQPAQVTDFTLGTDLLDLSALLQQAGYTGSDPVGAGYVKFLDDGHGDTWLYFDPTPSSDPWGDYIGTLQGVAPSQLSDASLVGASGGASPPPPPSPPPVSPPPASGGQTLQAQDGGATLTGGSGDDTLIGAHGPDQMTGAGGADQFTFNEVPWQGAAITDFTVGTDHIDVRSLLQQAGYSGSDPVGDGYVKFLDDGHGDTWLYFDPTPSSDPWGDYIATIQGVAPSSLSDASLTGFGGAASPPPPPTSPPPVSPPPSGGQTLQAQDGGSTLAGGSGDDTLIGAHGPDQMTGNAGADHFVFNEVPWQGAQITDFAPGTDKIDLTGLFNQYGYEGTDPVKEGWVKFLDDGHGDTWLYFDPTPQTDPWGDYIATIQGITPTQLSVHDII
jgi:hypothetical protein